MQVNRLSQKLQLVKSVSRLMGNRFEISVVTEDESCALEQIHAAVNEIRRIEQLLTTYNDQSQTALINFNAGIQQFSSAELRFGHYIRSNGLHSDQLSLHLQFK